jgi:hypothetical protein
MEALMYARLFLSVLVCLTLSSTAMAKGGGGSSGYLTMSGTAAIADGSCQRYTVTAHLSSGAVNWSASNLVVTLSGLGHGTAYSNSVCTNSASTVTIGGGSASFYFLDSTDEALTFHAAASGYTSASLAVTVNAGYPELAISGSTTPATSTCTPYTLATEDSYGSPTNVTTTAQVNSTGGGWSTDSGCTNRTTSLNVTFTGSTTIYFYDVTSGTVDVNISDDGFRSATIELTLP